MKININFKKTRKCKNTERQQCFWLLYSLLLCVVWSAGGFCWSSLSALFCCSMAWMFSFFFCGHPWITPGLVVSPYNERGIRTSSGWTCHKLHTLFYMLETIIFELGHENSQFPHLLSLAWFPCSEGCPMYGPYFRASTAVTWLPLKSCN